MILQFLELKFYYKKKPKIPQLDAFNIPESPQLSKYIYPSLQYYLSKNTKYFETLSAEDLASVETKVGILNPRNALFYTLAQASIVAESLKDDGKKKINSFTNSINSKIGSLNK